MGVGAGLYVYDVAVKSSRSLSHLLMSSCIALTLTRFAVPLRSNPALLSVITVQFTIHPVFGFKIQKLKLFDIKTLLNRFTDNSLT